MKALKIIGIVVVVLLLIAIALPFLINVNSFRPKLESALTEALGREVKVGNLSLSILSGSVSAEDLSIADDPAFSKDAFIRAKSLKVGVEVMPLIFSKSFARHRYHAGPARDRAVARCLGEMELFQPGRQVGTGREAGAHERKLVHAGPLREQARREEWPPVGQPGELFDQASRL